MTKTNRNHRSNGRARRDWAMPAMLLSGHELADYAFHYGFLFSLLAREDGRDARRAARKVSPGIAGLTSMGPAAKRGESWGTAGASTTPQTPRHQAASRRKTPWAQGSLGRLLGPAWEEGNFIPVLNRTQGEAK